MRFKSGVWALTPTNGDMSQATVTANPISNGAGDARHDRWTAVVAAWTGSPVGTLQLYGSVDQLQYIPMGTAVAVSGAGNYGWDVVETGFQFFQLVYTKNSGSGTLAVSFGAKGE